jgi:spoIIIJ-associated protein
MIELFKFEGKTKEEAEAKLVEKTNSKIEDFYFQYDEQEAKLFKSKKIDIIAIKKSEVVFFVKNFINELSAKMNIDIKSEVNEKDETISVLLISDNNPVLIGKDGRTLNSIQTIVKQTILASTGFMVKINVDVSNYKAKKMKNLEYDIKRIVKEVIRTKMEVVLDPMNSYERRYVHNIVSQHPELQSLSSGDGKERRITISYKETE